MTTPRLRRGAGPALAILSVAVVLGVVLSVRWHLHFANVDDYLYADQTYALKGGFRHGLHSGIDALRMFSTNSPLVPLVAIPIAVVNESPNALVLVQVVFLAMLGVAVWSILRHVGMSSATSIIVACAVAGLPPVIAYAAMFHFALAASACSVMCLAAYLDCEQFSRRGVSIGVGIAFGLLSLSRVLAPIYVLAIAVPVAVDFLLSRPCRRAFANASLGAGVAAVIGGPWWILNGGDAFRYLTGYGYDASSGLTPKASLLEAVGNRFTTTASQTGNWLLYALIALVVIGLVRAWRNETLRATTLSPVALCAAAAALSFAALATSANQGTGFALPCVVLLAAAVAAAAPLWSRRGQIALALLSVLFIASSSVVALQLRLPGVVAEGVLREPVLARGELQTALGCACRATTEALNRDVLDLAGRATVLLLRDDAAVNTNSLNFWARDRPTAPALRTVGFGVVTLHAAALEGMEFVVTGTSADPYHSRLDQRSLRRLLIATSYRVVMTRRLSPHNDVVVWKHVPSPESVRYRPTRAAGSSS